MHMVLQQLVETYVEGEVSQSGWIYISTQDTDKILKHLVEALYKGLQPNQNQAEFNLGCLRLAKFLIQLSPPGMLDNIQ